MTQLAIATATLMGVSPVSSAPFTFTVTPAAIGKQLVRISLPFPKEFLTQGRGIEVIVDGKTLSAAIRVLTYHPGTKSVRRALVTFPYTFKTLQPISFQLLPAAVSKNDKPKLLAKISVDGDEVTISYKNGPQIKAKIIAPARESKEPAKLETVESNHCYLWQRYHIADKTWPRVIEVRADALGGVVVVGHIQRNLPNDAYAPNLGWSIETPASKVSLHEGDKEVPLASTPTTHKFSDETPCEALFDGYKLYNPAAPIKRKGHVEAQINQGKLSYTYYRCKAEEKTPMQPATWQRAEFVVAPSQLAPITVTLESPHTVSVGWELWDQLYATGEPSDFRKQADLAEILKYHRNAVVRSVAHGDDWGNITGYSDDSMTGAVAGMNRLNHCPPIFMEGYRSGDARLTQAAVLWCDNMYDLSIWWGEDNRGGTRYNNVNRFEKTPFDDQSYMWRSSKSVDFCTKGYDSFFIAYEETGDPRMKEALDVQVPYASKNVHAVGQCRNIGDVRDFIRLYEYTGEKRHLDDALRLFRELRPKLSTGNLFDQGGNPLSEKLGFIDNDKDGRNYGYAKPYIIGYGLIGVPELGKYVPDEPKLRDMVQAVADFLADSQDPLGGWRYPHPRSSYLSLAQAFDNAWQLVHADKFLGAQEKHLDAIERVLRQRIQGWKKTGRMFGGVGGWEAATGKIKPGEQLHDLYSCPEDRDFTKDYTEGSISFGGGPPEGIVYFPEVLDFYLKHRPLSRLLEVPKLEEPLGKVLARVEASLPKSDPTQVADCGVKDKMPTFADRLANRLTFPMSWLSGTYKDFNAWKKTARAKVMDCLSTPPPDAPFEPKVISEQDRGSYVARKIELNITGDSRVTGYLLVPKGKGPFPAVLLLHDHGARFDIGKEKVVRPWDCSPERLASAEEWVNTCYGGRFIGDELAKRGYVCFVTDALNWGDRGGAGYDGQHALACNLIHLGMTHAGLIAYEDMRAAEFLATRPEVDSKHVASMGLSMGCFRTWQVAALSDNIKAAVAICWMATVKGLMVPGNNHTGGQSAYTMTHPGLYSYLDYPDVASIACPKPMLFYAGLQDGLFPIPSVKDAFGKLHDVWQSQSADGDLVTKLWDVPHCFDREMQEEAFAWLDVKFGVI